MFFILYEYTSIVAVNFPRIGQEEIDTININFVSEVFFFRESCE